VLDDDDTDHIVSVQLDDEESMAQFLDSHNPDDVSLCCFFSSCFGPADFTGYSLHYSKN